MSQPRRFKAMRGPEAQLVALGCDERPDPEVKRRVAQRLGITAAAIAAAGTTTLAANAAAAATASGAKAIGAATSAFGGTTASFVAATFVKATVISLVLGAASYSGVRIYTSRSVTHASSVALAKAPAAKPFQAHAVAARVTVAPPASEQPMPEASSARPSAAPSGNSSAAAIAPALEQPASGLRDPSAFPVARFADVESLGVPPSGSSNAPVATSAPALLHEPGATSSRGALPVDPRLAREVTSLDLARASARRGDSAAALRELSSFDASYGYVALRKEAMLVHVDVLLSLGRKVEAAAVARQLLLAGAPANQRTRLEALSRANP